MTVYDTGFRQYSLPRMHRRRMRPSTKVGNNTYARHERIQSADGTQDWEVTITQHNTDIIKCLYRVSAPNWMATQMVNDENGRTVTSYVMEEILMPSYLELDTGGYNTMSTLTRLNKFLRNNKIGFRVNSKKCNLYYTAIRKTFDTTWDLWTEPAPDNKITLLLDDSNSDRLIRKYTQENKPSTPFELRNPLGEAPFEPITNPTNPTATGR